MNLVDRVKRILLSPRTEWEVIDAEQTTPAALYTGYIAPLAAIGPIAQLIGHTVFGIPVPFVGTIRVPFGSALTGAVIGYVLTLVGTYVLALIIDALAPTSMASATRSKRSRSRHTAAPLRGWPASSRSSPCSGFSELSVSIACTCFILACRSS